MRRRNRDALLRHQCWCALEELSCSAVFEVIRFLGGVILHDCWGAEAENGKTLSFADFFDTGTVDGQDDGVARGACCASDEFTRLFDGKDGGKGEDGGEEGCEGNNG